jgi:hypothetical protein
MDSWNNSSTACTVCKLLTGLVAAVLAVLTVVAAIAVYQVHVTPSGFVFGRLEGSAAIITLILSMGGLWKTCRWLCPCGSKGGVCPNCGGNPCRCG